MVRPSLPYQGIARRGLALRDGYQEPAIYERDIDVSCTLAPLTAARVENEWHTTKEEDQRTPDPVA